MNQSARKIMLRTGIIGLAANVAVLFLFGLLLPLTTMLVGYVATKRVFEQTKPSENPPTFWDGAKIGLISGSIATLPILLLGGVGLSLIDIANGDPVFAFMDSDIIPFVGLIVLLLLGFCIVLSTIAGGVTATKSLRKPNKPV